MIAATALRSGLAALALLSVAAIAPAPAGAAVVQCLPGAGTQHDMQGAYVSPPGEPHQIRVDIYPCGGALVQWDNAYGRHYAGYGTVERVPGQGVIATALPESAERLDSSYAIMFKAAERGYIQVITVSPYGELLGVYRLRKLN